MRPGGGSEFVPRWRSLLLLFVVPAFFVLLEGALWMTGVRPLAEERDPFLGFSKRMHVFRLEPGRGVYATEPHALTYSFDRQEFLKDKPANGFRVFVLGGSSARGFPWGARVAFTRLLGDALQSSWPDRKVEAINAAAMSYGSHRMRILAHEVLDYAPDVLVLYEGHNEFVETRFYRDVLERTESLDPLRGLLYRWRLYAGMTRLMGRGGAGAGAAVWQAGHTGNLLGLDVVREQTTETSAAEKARVGALFEENLRAIVDLARRRGVRVVLCTVASNVRDWAPNQSIFEPATAPGAREASMEMLARGRGLLARGGAAGAAGAALALEEARKLAPGHAESDYLLGRAYENQGLWDAARAAYTRARDEDAQPSRAPGSFNETIRRVARESGAAVLLVDIERVFEEGSPHGLVGFNLTEDYVHPTPAGHDLIAREIWKRFVEDGLAGPPRKADAAEFRRAVGEPAAGAPAGGGAGAEAASAAWLYNLGFVLQHQGNDEQAIEKYRACLELSPGYYAAAFNLGTLLQARGRADLAAEAFGRALAAKPDDLDSVIGLGMAQAELGQLEEAAATLTRATRLDPGSAMAFSDLGFVLSRKGDTPGATTALRMAVQLAPDHPIPLSNLAGALRAQGQVDEAIRLYRLALERRHDFREARHGLAEALLARGDRAEAEGLYRALLAADPADQKARAGLAAASR